MKFLIAVCVLAAISWLFASRLIGPEYLKLDYEDRAARDYLTRAIPKIVGKWDFKALEERTTGEQHVSENWKFMPEKFKTYRRDLGPAESYAPMEGVVDVDDTRGSEIVLGTYTQRISFKRATADIIAAVVKRNGTWKISRFSVRSAAIPASLDDDHM